MSLSELINNREFRKKAIKEIILELHNGKAVEEVKRQFDEIIKDVSSVEIAAIEQELINEGLPIEEVRRLCDVHLAIFKDAIKSEEVELIPGHPVYTFKAENRAIENLVEEVYPLLDILKSASGEEEKQTVLKLREKINLLWDVEKHYSRKENLLFPFLEKYEITGPSKIMWSHDDEIRELLKQVKRTAADYQNANKEHLISSMEEALSKIKEMITKEEKVLFNTALQVLSEDEWYYILQDSAEVGYCLIEPENRWKPVNLNVSARAESTQMEHSKGYIKFDTGVLTAKEISLIFNHLPVDITYVDKEGLVKYFSANKDRIFVRARSIIGRKVENCHPPASLDVVEKLVEDLASGKKEHEDFWLHLGDKYVYIRYFAVRDENSEFVGVIEVSQDITPIQAITGEKRIAD